MSADHLVNGVSYHIANSTRVVWIDIYKEIPLIIVLASALGILRWILSATFYRPVAKTLGLDSKDTRKFVENAWFGTYYTGVVALCCYLFWNADWLWGKKWPDLFYDHPVLSDDATFPHLRTFYCLELAFYFQALYSLVFIDERKKDFYEYVIHHWATLFLVSWSLIFRWHRVGVLVLLIHDVVDMILYVAKAFFECGYVKIANAMFPLLLGTTAFCRLYVLPWILYDCIFFSESTLYRKDFYMGYDPNAFYPIEITTYGICGFHYCVNPFWVLVSFLTVLQVLHVYWFFLMVRLAIKTVKNGGDIPGDIRDHDFEERKNKHLTKNKNN